LEVITRLLHSDEPVNFPGSYYTINEGILLPRPQRPGGPPILIGGNGPHRTLPLVAKYASEWNAVYLSHKAFRERSQMLDEMVVENGRTPTQVRRSLMTRIEIGDDAALRPKFSSATPAELRQRGLVLGTPTQIVDQLGKWGENGVQRIMLQWLNLDDMDGLEILGTQILPQV